MALETTSSDELGSASTFEENLRTIRENISALQGAAHFRADISGIKEDPKQTNEEVGSSEKHLTFQETISRASYNILDKRTTFLINQMHRCNLHIIDIRKIRYEENRSVFMVNFLKKTFIFGGSFPT